MAQATYSMTNKVPTAYLSDLNGNLAAIVSNNSGSSEPSTTFAGMIWADSTADPWIYKVRNAADDAWSALFDSDGDLVPAGDLFIADTKGVVIGHTAKISFGAVPEFQILGTGAEDSSMGFGRWGTVTGGATLRFLKSRHTTIGSNTIVQDGDELGRIRFQAADGSDFNTNAAEISAEVDGTPGENDMPGRILFSTTSDGASSVTERMRIDSSGDMTLTGGIAVGGDLALGASGVNTLFQAYLECKNDINAITAPAATEIVFAASRTTLFTIAFDKDAVERAAAHILMPEDYDGRALAVTIYWTARAGTTGDVVWRIGTMAHGDGDDLTLTTGLTSATITDPFQGVDLLHVASSTVTPGNRGTDDDLIALDIFRFATTGTDTFDADAHLIGIKVSY